ncbi:ROK family transcriptional regulator [Petrotoga sp. 9PWA.NaAc.5.4]|uniref:ROK family transcriptional regulator n=1 Tax=Petrotoga sp. 9PWA.NaAc.5.4 TaxID=1434328 RepID=UPI000CC920D1|nr:ROK family transcriptional regulator [Petrotoga sp. 9PWA.NaAc.5.4]PNR92579.1 hypothetical protein X924_09750 [Petrotoga sp. 9PWA.NaAc.5.4]
MPSQKYSNKKIKNNNLKLVLMEILQNGPISRADISKRTHLTRSTVSQLVEKLIEEGLVKEMNKEEKKEGPGKKAILLSGENEKFYVIGYDLTITNSKLIVMNLKGDIVKKSSFLPLKELISIQNIELIVKSFYKSIESIKKELNISNDAIRGIGVALPGLVSHKNKSISFTPNLEQYFDFQSIEKFSEKLDIPIIIDNNANMKALGELIYGIGKEFNNFLFVNVSYGIGAGLIINGQLFRGKYNLTGEIGHVKVVEDGDVCSCGMRGCLETFSSVRSIVKKYYELSGKNLDKKFNIDTIVKKARKGDEIAIKIIRDSGFYLGKVIGNTLNIINLETVVFGGEIIEYWDILENDFYRGLNETALDLVRKNITIQLSKLGDEITAIGAASIVLEDIFR